MAVQRIPYLVIGVGVVLAVASWLTWKPCLDGDLASCYDLLNQRPWELARSAAWAVALVTCGVGFIPRYGRVGAAVGLMSTILAVPILDPGFPVAGLNSADGNPGAGIISGLILIGGGALYAALSEVDRRRAAGGMTPLGVPTA
ncbi:hypothetical protein M3667_14525 [Microbacterium sp. P26]|uniref:hypothetical protein n=1 Tax=Microbacterium TaxID=33882 RepID=UPI00203BC350|nr:hypothetical protein [Microbacterium sp. P26]MCM3503084.1 hypothetical protein [Microbacterium sp. P26]